MPTAPPPAPEQPKKPENNSRTQQLDRLSRSEPTPEKVETPPIYIHNPQPKDPSPPAPIAPVQAPQAYSPPVSKPATSKPLEGIAAIAQSLAVGASKPAPPQPPMSPPTSRPRPRSDTAQVREELGERPVVMVSTELLLKRRTIQGLV